MKRLLVFLLVAVCEVCPGAEPQTDVTVWTTDLFQLASVAGGSPARGSPFSVMGIAAQRADAAGEVSPTTRQAIEESVERCRRAGMLDAEGKLTATGKAVWHAMASPRVAVQVKRISPEGIGAVWYGLTADDFWGLAPQKDGNVRIFGPFSRDQAASLLASRLALPPSERATAWNETFDLFEWVILLCVERERIAALAPEAGESTTLGATADQVGAALLTPRTLSLLSGDPSLDPTAVMLQYSNAASVSQMLDALVDRGWLARSRFGGSARYLLSTKGADLARQVLYPRETLQITTTTNRAGQLHAAIAQFCTASEGRAMVRYLPGSHQLVISSIPAGDAQPFYVQTIATLLKVTESPAIPGSQAVASPGSDSAPAAGVLPGETIREELRRGSYRTGAAVRTRQVWGRGKIDLWSVSTRDDKRVDVEYEDTDGDGTPDFVRVRDFPEGPFTRSFIFRDGKWEESNILEAFLEVTFKLPWDRSAYHPHDVNVILNDQVIAQLIGMIPEGLYRFPVRPQDLKVDADSAQANDVRLETLHLRGGHYVVSSDFKLTIRLSQVSRYVVADDPSDAEKTLREKAQLRVDGIDLGLYANGLSLYPPSPKAEEVATIRGEVHNIGMEPAAGWKVQFHDGNPKAGGTLIHESELERIEPGDVLAVEAKWPAKPGERRIFATLVVPAGVKDQREDNNQASISTGTNAGPATLPASQTGPPG